MNKIIPFSKDIYFKENIGEIVSIKIEDKLKFEEEYTINGDIVISGVNKYNDIESDFLYTLPVSISVDSKYNTHASNIAIDDFYYEIINEDILRVNIELCLDNLFYKEEEKREINLDVDFTQKEDLVDINTEIPNEDKKLNIELKEKKDDEIEETKENDEQEKEKNDKEYSLYCVYTFLENDSLDNILAKYKITMDELEIYNDLSKIVPGTKLIIPSVDE